MSEVTIVTGAAGGIGYAVADLLLQRNPNLICAVVDAQTGWSSALVEAYGADRVAELAVDVRDHGAVADCVERVAGDIGPPSGLVNCAGIQHNCAALDLQFSDWKRVLDVNLGGTFSFCQAVARHMLPARRGAIVNLASISMHFGFPGRLPYVASKAAIGGLTRTLAVEWAPHGVRCNAVAPGFVQTPLLQHAIDSGHVDRAVALSHHAQTRFADPIEVAAAVAYLLSSDASFVTGVVFDVDGGFRVKKV